MKHTAHINALLAGIDNIIFDLGGVVVDIDYIKTQQAFEALGLAGFGEAYSQAAQTGVFDLYEKGLISTEAFRARLRDLTPNLKISNEELDEAWNAMILGLPPYRLAVLEKIKARFRTFLLSNTNKLHITYFHNQLQAVFGKEDLNGYFEKVYYSYELGLRKPDKEIFDYVLRENGLDAKRTLFVDDTIRHVESAKSIGIEAIHIRTAIDLNELYAVFSEYPRG